MFEVFVSCLKCLCHNRVQFVCLWHNVCVSVIIHRIQNTANMVHAFVCEWLHLWFGIMNGQISLRCHCLCCNFGDQFTFHISVKFCVRMEGRIIEPKNVEILRWLQCRNTAQTSVTINPQLARLQICSSYHSCLLFCFQPFQNISIFQQTIRF